MLYVSASNAYIRANCGGSGHQSPTGWLAIDSHCFGEHIGIRELQCAGLAVHLARDRRRHEAEPEESIERVSRKLVLGGTGRSGGIEEPLQDFARMTNVDGHARAQLSAVAAPDYALRERNADLLLGEAVRFDAAVLERHALFGCEVLHVGPLAFDDQCGRPPRVVIGEHAGVEHDQPAVI